MGSLEQMEVPPAQTARRAGWRDPRLWVGVSMVAVSVVLGAQVVGSADDSVAVWAVGADTARGTGVDALELVPTRVRFTSDATSGRYLLVEDGTPQGLGLVRSVGAGELLPRDALGSVPDDVVVVSVEVPSSQVPPSVAAGSVVDLWSAPRNPSDTTTADELLRDVTVVSAGAPGQDLTGASRERQVVLQLPDRSEAVARIVSASGAGELVLVARG